MPRNNREEERKERIDSAREEVNQEINDLMAELINVRRLCRTTEQKDSVAELVAKLEILEVEAAQVLVTLS